MDPDVRKVYLSVVVLLLLLWMGMFVWAVKPARLNIFQTEDSPVKFVPKDFRSQLFQIPGIKFSVYQVQAGDAYSSISIKFNLSEATLRSLNQANDKTEPNPGSSLIIPSREGIYHIVRAGQGMGDLARAYGVPLRDILLANHKRGDSDLNPGEVLYLPKATFLTRSDPKWMTLEALVTRSGFLKPTTGRFADGYGFRIHPLSGKRVFHEGLDLAPGWRARVVAAQRGTVFFTGIRAGYGRLIVLDHGGGLTSYYAHLDEILVKIHQNVARGDLIGKVGNTGKTTGPHLHFEVRQNGTPKNPFLYLVQ